MNDNLFIQACIQLLGINSKVEIRLRPTGYGKYKKLAGCCETRYRKGVISGFVFFINLDVVFGAGWSMNDVIAHEFVHAVMIENDIHNPEYHHDKRFQGICRELEKNLKKAGFKVGKLYSADSDID